jgi:aquaporin Z
MAATMMLMVLYVTTHHKQSNYTGIYAGALVATFITIWAPVSGMSINPARSFGSAMPSGVWEGFWIYVTAPPLGMLAAAEIFLWREGHLRVKCCKLHHDNDKRCIFCGANGGFPGLTSEHTKE